MSVFNITKEEFNDLVEKSATIHKVVVRENYELHLMSDALGEYFDFMGHTVPKNEVYFSYDTLLIKARNEFGNDEYLKFNFYEMNVSRVVKELFKKVDKARAKDNSKLFLPETLYDSMLGFSLDYACRISKLSSHGLEDETQNYYEILIQEGVDRQSEEIRQFVVDYDFWRDLADLCEMFWSDKYAQSLVAYAKREQEYKETVDDE